MEFYSLSEHRKTHTKANARLVRDSMGIAVAWVCDACEETVRKYYGLPSGGSRSAVADGKCEVCGRHLDDRGNCPDERDH